MNYYSRYSKANDKKMEKSCKAPLRGARAKLVIRDAWRDYREDYRNDASDCRVEISRVETEIMGLRIKKALILEYSLFSQEEQQQELSKLSEQQKVLKHSLVKLNKNLQNCILNSKLQQNSKFKGK